MSPPPVVEDLSSLPDNAVVVWFDADFYEDNDGTRSVIAGFEADAWKPPKPFVVPFVGGRIGYATEIAKTFGGYGFDASSVIPSGVPSAGDLSKLGAEIFDLFVAWSGLNYVKANHHSGPVVVLGDGTSAVEFMRYEHDLDLSDYGIETSAMRALIEELYPATDSVRWGWIDRPRNLAVRVVQERLKTYLRDKKPGGVAF